MTDELKSYHSQLKTLKIFMTSGEYPEAGRWMVERRLRGSEEPLVPRKLHQAGGAQRES